ADKINQPNYYIQPELQIVHRIKGRKNHFNNQPGIKPPETATSRPRNDLAVSPFTRLTARATPDWIPATAKLFRYYAPEKRSHQPDLLLIHELSTRLLFLLNWPGGNVIFADLP